jgi:hypothetical protein
MDPITMNNKSIDSLNALLIGELAAIETYDQAIDKLCDDSMPILITNRTCHLDRLVQLRQRIHALGGTPISISAVWAHFAKLLAGDPELFGRESVAAALEAGEQMALANYQSQLDQLDPVSHTAVSTVLLPDQLRTLHQLVDFRSRKIPSKRKAGSLGNFSA